ncbi:MAG TPA: hypothetical protein VHC44_02585 [Verrucomicrobiae bacterium]|nr:hypothetical protein [Verrucomicrobiae bacterium]
MATVRPILQDEGQGEWPSSSNSETNTTSTGQGSGFSRVIAPSWRALRELFAPPMGYEDETGFHYGDPPKPA